MLARRASASYLLRASTADVPFELVTDMVVALMGTCHPELMENSDEECMIALPESLSQDTAERRRIEGV